MSSFQQQRRQSVAQADPVPTLAEKLDDEAESQDEQGTAFNRVVAAEIRALAARCRDEGIGTAEQYLDRYPGGYHGA